MIHNYIIPGQDHIIEWAYTSKAVQPPVCLSYMLEILVGPFLQCRRARDSFKYIHYILCTSLIYAIVSYINSTAAPSCLHLHELIW